MKKLIILLVFLSSCAGTKVHGPNAGKNFKSGSQVVAYTQKSTFESVMKKTDPDRKLLWVFPYPDFLR
tara:strand:+ start:444 stop:647 length:204 start_codon:yes stop_codon:yes gene_type:complete